MEYNIINTIGSIDDLIDNYNKQYSDILKIGLARINYFNQIKSKINLNKICLFEKGLEVGSKKYITDFDINSIKYIRVGDLLNKSNTFINKTDAKNIAIEEDILLALDGAPGRNNIGLSGSFSSGIYKIVSDKKYKGLLFFEINSNLNQKIIKDLAQGTTILHASKSIPFLQTIMCNELELKYFNNLFNLLVNLKKKIDLLQKEKNLLLNKYFTNQ